MRLLTIASKTRTAAVSAGCAALLAACATPNVSTDVRAPGPNDPSIVVIGTALRTSLQFGRGTVDAQGGWLPDVLSNLTQSAPATEIYQVRSLPPTDDQHPYGIYGIDRFHIKCGSNTLVFSLPPGHVLYLTDVGYTVNEGAATGAKEDKPRTAQLYTHTDYQRARAYIDARYPQLKGRLEPGRIELHPVGSGTPGLGNCMR